jgi:hypothetical protein
MPFPVFHPRRSLIACLWLCAWAGLESAATQALAQTCTTTIAGKVYAPNQTDPLPNILVYVPTTPVQAFTTQGPGSCGTPAAFVSGNPLVSTTTAFDGSFSLTGPGLAGSNVTVVVQAGKWRRQYTGLNVPACQTINLIAAMPANQAQGDLPRIAISTGGSDAIECILRSNKMGLSDSEFTAPSGTGSIQLYAGSGTPGITYDASGTRLPSETALVGAQATLDSYDLAIFACQGTPSVPAALVTQNQTDLTNYANIGGRVFATHYNYVWLEDNAAFQGVANWIADDSIATAAIPATINQGFPEGATLAKWLQGIGATSTLGQMPLTDTRADQRGVNAPTQSWATLNYSDGRVTDPVMQFTFDTPINAPTTPVITLAFNNTPANFQQGDAADTILIDVSNTSPSASADASLNMSLTLPTGLTAVSLAGTNPGTGWVCSTATLVCNRTAPLAAGASDPVTLTTAVSNTAPIGTGTVSARISGGGISGTNQCGRVLFNEYHVESVSNAGQNTFPKECANTAMTPQEKFLEFSLYNLSNFVAPITTDNINIQAQPLISTLLAAPEPSVYATGFSVTASLTPANGGAMPTGSVTFAVDGVAAGSATLSNGTATLAIPSSIYFTLTPGTHSLTAAYGGDTNYPAQSLSGSHTVSREPTTITFTPTTPPTVSFGQAVNGVYSVLYTNEVGSTPPSGTISVLDGSTVGCTVPLGAPCPYGSPILLPAGVHPISIVYSGDSNYLPSTSVTITFTVLPDITTATVTSSLNPAILNDNVTFTATISGNYAVPVGSVTFYDGTVALGSATLDASGIATLSTNTLAVGLHPITVIYGATPNFLAATSPVLNQIVKVAPVVLPSAVQLTSSLNPAPPLIPVTLTAVVTTPGPFVQIPSGVVTFFDGAAEIGSGTLNGTGFTTFTTSGLTAGNHAITASYTGTAASGGGPPNPPGPIQPVGSQARGGVHANASAPGTSASVSSVLTQTIGTPLSVLPASFTITANPSPANVAAGEYAVMQIQVTEIGGFSQPVQLSCTGLPAQTSCIFQIPAIPAGGGTTTLYVLPQGPHSCANPSAPYYSGNLPLLPLTAPLVAGLGLAALPRRRRKLRNLLAVIAVAGAAALMGCGSCTDLGVSTGTYSFTVTGTAQGGPVTQTQSLPLQINVLLP